MILAVSDGLRKDELQLFVIGNRDLYAAYAAGDIRQHLSERA